MVDNSGSGRAQAGGERVRILTNASNVGFGTAINQAIRDSEAPLIAALNDDAAPHPEWLAALIKAAEARPKAGMFASQVRLAGTDQLDSAGMLIARDGSSKQRGHGEPPAKFAANSGTLFPSGSAALYRRKMLDEDLGLLDELFFVYCEDTDLGLRARWAGWEGEYVAGAVVDHAYSQSAGRASPLKAYYVERNRLYTVIKNFPFSMLALVKFFAFARYYWHVVFMITRTGKAAEFRGIGASAVAAAVSRFARARVGAGAITISFSGTAAHFQDAPPQLERVSRVAGRAFDRSAEGCRTVSGLLVLILAYNEEGAIGGVVHEVRAAMPGAPILVVDDCSSDATIHIARAAGARVLSLPHHLGLGGAVQAGYRLAFELDYDYVIRVDGDGQHDPRDIPKMLETLEREKCEMVIGSRFVDGSGEHSGDVCAADWASKVF